jgi:hypothetical protein
MKTSCLIKAYLMATVVIVMAACQKSEGDTQIPVISNIEVGHNDTIHIGEGLHLEFEATDNDKLDYYRIIIHAEDTHKSALWAFDSTFTEIRGLRNATVHHHIIAIPNTIAEGHYHFELYVADMSGNTAKHETEVVATTEDDDHDH